MRCWRAEARVLCSSRGEHIPAVPSVPVRIALLLVLVAFVATTTSCSWRKAPAPKKRHATPAAIEHLNRRAAAAAVTVPQYEGKREYLVGPDDLLEVSLFDIEEANGEPRVVLARVSQGGLISLPLLGHIEVADLSALQIENDLRERYREFIHEPQITVFVKEYHSYRISVVGYVEKPGLYEVQGDKTLLEVLGMAGGLNREAGNMLEVTRRTSNGLRTHYVELDRLMREGDLRFNIPLRPGDVITVPKASVFFVAGSVNKPGAYPIRTGLTLTQAVATAGGPDQRLARAGKTALVRPGPNGERLKFKFNLGDIESGKVADPQIYENDIVIVPMNHAKYMMEMLLGRVGVGFSAPLVK